MHSKEIKLHKYKDNKKKTQIYNRNLVTRKQDLKKKSIDNIVDTFLFCDYNLEENNKRAYNLNVKSKKHKEKKNLESRKKLEKKKNLMKKRSRKEKYRIYRKINLVPKKLMNFIRCMEKDSEINIIYT